jgi:hypothetical protein
MIVKQLMTPKGWTQIEFIYVMGGFFGEHEDLSLLSCVVILDVKTIANCA